MENKQENFSYLRIRHISIQLYISNCIFGAPFLVILRSFLLKLYFTMENVKAANNQECNSNWSIFEGLFSKYNYNREWPAFKDTYSNMTNCWNCVKSCWRKLGMFIFCVYLILKKYPFLYLLIMGSGKLENNAK